jgi:hypothetical protein
MIRKVFKNIFYSIEKIGFDVEYLEEMYEEMLSSYKRHRDSITIDKRKRRDKLQENEESPSLAENQSNLSNRKEANKLNNQSQYEKLIKSGSEDGYNLNEDKLVNVRRHNMAFKIFRSMCDKNLTRLSN